MASPENTQRGRSGAIVAAWTVQVGDTWHGIPVTAVYPPPLHPGYLWIRTDDGRWTKVKETEGLEGVEWRGRD